MNKYIIKTDLYVNKNKVSVIRINNKEYISLTDLARYANPEEPKIPVQTWMRNKDVISYLGLWEKLNNENFKGRKFDTLNSKLAEKGNIRDYTDLLHLVILNNLENTNAELINAGIAQSERLVRLNESARRQFKVLQNDKRIKNLEELQQMVNNDEILKLKEKN